MATRKRTPGSAAEKTAAKAKGAAAGKARAAAGRVETRARGASEAPSRLDAARARMYQQVVSDAAEAVFARAGFDGATMQEIAQDAGVSLKTVYAAFPGKQELYLSIMNRRGAEFMKSVHAAVEAAGSAMEALESFARTYASFLLEHRTWLQIHLRSRIAWSLRPDDEDSAALWQQGNDFTVALIRRGIEEGVFYPVDPEEAAAVATTLLKVQASHAVELGEDDAEALGDRMTSYVQRMLCLPSALPA